MVGCQEFYQKTAIIAVLGKYCYFRQFILQTQQKFNSLYGCKCQDVSDFMELKIHQKQAGLNMNYLEKEISFQAKETKKLILRIIFASVRSSLVTNSTPWLISLGFFCFVRFFLKHTCSKDVKSQKRKCLKV